MKTGFIVLSLLLSNFPAALTQAPRQEFTDPLALLQAVAKTYAAGADTFHMESIAESTENTELHREWRKVYHTAIKSPGNLYRIETRSPFGSFIQVSDGTDEWVYLVETKMFVKHPLPQDWPQFFRIPVLGSNEISQAWNMRTWLDADAGTLSELPQIYERRSQDALWYQAPSFGYEGLLELAPNGFIRSYPGLWEAEAST